MQPLGRYMGTSSSPAVSFNKALNKKLKERKSMHFFRLLLFSLVLLSALLWTEAKNCSESDLSRLSCFFCCVDCLIEFPYWFDERLYKRPWNEDDINGYCMFECRQKPYTCTPKQINDIINKILKNKS